mmetsp:Transcript_37007/g.95954  ORF Transcript_37007/g.95954 Transcript_37007/m.95954 type:complete len:125 (+) Transcript_37007:766-1140(+)
MARKEVEDVLVFLVHTAESVRTAGPGILVLIVMHVHAKKGGAAMRASMAPVATPALPPTSVPTARLAHHAASTGHAMTRCQGMANVYVKKGGLEQSATRAPLRISVLPALSVQHAASMGYVMIP